MRQLLIIIPLFALLGLSGCKTSRSMERQSTDLHDSVRIRDSVRIKDSIRWMDSTRLVKLRSDSVYRKDSSVLIKDQQGNIISQVHWHYSERVSSSSDSVMFFKQIAKFALEDRNSALQELRELKYSKSKQQVIVKEPPFITRLPNYLYAYLLGFLSCAVVGILLNKKLKSSQSKHSSSC